MTDYRFVKERVLGAESVRSNGYLKVVAQAVHDASGVRTYEKVVRKDAVAVLVFNSETREIIAVRQYRYPVDMELVEVVAGLIEDHERPEDAALREVVEETGYTPVKVEYMGSVFMSPGYSTEQMFFYIAEVRENRDVDSDLGLGVDEGENINLVRIPVDDLYNAQWNDAKSLIAASYAVTRILANHIVKERPVGPPNRSVKEGFFS